MVDDDKPRGQFTLDEVLDLALEPAQCRDKDRIEINNDPVRVRGNPLSEIWWRGKQWAVTAYGIECLDGTYPIVAVRLSDEPHMWPLHMAEKSWVDIDEFTTAWMVALVLHRKSARLGQFDPDAILEMFGRLPPKGPVV